MSRLTLTTLAACAACSAWTGCDAAPSPLDAAELDAGAHHDAAADDAATDDAAAARDAGADSGARDAGPPDPPPVLTPGWWTEVAPPTRRFYVDGAAPDNEGAGSIDDPWRDITFAADQTGPGDAVIIRAGTYVDQDNRPGTAAENSGINPGRGTLREPKWFMAFPGERVVIDGGGYLHGGFNINASAGNAHAYVVISGLELRNFTRGGVYLHNDTTGYIAIVNNWIHDIVGPAGTNVGGVRIDEDDCEQVYIANNLIHDVRVGPSPETENAAGVHSYRMFNVVAEYNEIHHTPDAFYLKSPNHAAYRGDNRLRRNYLHDLDRSALSFNDNTSTPFGHLATTFEHNLVLRSRWGIEDETHNIRAGSPPSAGLVWRHNTLVDIREDYFRLRGHTDVHHTDNLYFGCSDEATASRDSVPHTITTISQGSDPQSSEIRESDYNLSHPWSARLNHYNGEAPVTLYSSLAEWQRAGFGDAPPSLNVSAPGPDAHSIEADPLFAGYSGGSSVDADRDDFRLRDASPARGAASDGGHMGCYQSSSDVVGLLPSPIVLAPM